MLEFRSPKPINGLGGISDAKQSDLFGGEVPQDAELEGVGILHFIDANFIEILGEVLSEIGLFSQGL